MAKVKKEVVESVEQQDYEHIKKEDNVVIIGAANAKHLKEGVEYEVTGEIAAILLSNGKAILKQ